jgi:tetratricopeptide (TPR) repeat protein
MRAMLMGLAAVAVAATLYVYSTTASEETPIPDLAPVGATLLDGLGDHGMPITSDHPDVQQWFDQGVMLTYGFNHDAAERSFLKAAELDPSCAMCWWGAALVLGPNINAAMDPAANAAAWERVQVAQGLSSNATERERAYIEALSARYTEAAPADRTSLDAAYADAMAELSAAYPDDLDAATWYAESLMTLQPWDFWDDDGAPKGNTPEILATLESVLERNENHPGALHLYIHAVEASDDPDRGVVAADRLRSLIPGSGHLVHMPAHIYARVGRWHDAVVVNQEAAAADDAYLAVCRPAPGVYPLGYVPHNHHFLWFAATMQGSREIASEAAAETARRTSDPELMRAEGMQWVQNFAVTPLLTQVRFGLWDEIRATPQPDDDLAFMSAIWHYAQGVAATRQGRFDDAERHRGAVAKAATDPAIADVLWFDRYSMGMGVEIAERVLAAELANARGNQDEAIEILTKAAALEDALPYDEPPGWHQPVRQLLGAVLLDAGDPKAAEAVYAAELRRNPENGWSLFGLAEALRQQDRLDEAKQIDARFAKAWAHADTELTASAF